MQKPIAGTVLGETIGVPLWRSLPSWYLVAEEDQIIPPDAQRFFAQRMGATTLSAKASHVILISKPKKVADLIDQVARALEADD